MSRVRFSNQLGDDMPRSPVHRRPFALAALTGLLIAAIVAPTAAAVLVEPATTKEAGPFVADHGPLPPAAAPQPRSADLAAALGADGTFLGASGVAGTVDARAWTLVSDLAAGEPPRFAPAARPVSSAATGPWSAVGSGGAINNLVAAVAVSGSNLYVGGVFTNAAGIEAADYVARWNGNAWSALGSNGSGDGALGFGWVDALAVSGSDLYVGGGFTNAAGIETADYVARWSGGAWSALGSNGSGDGALGFGWVDALAVSGSDLYVGGGFENAAGIWGADNVAKWGLGAGRRPQARRPHPPGQR
jgi:hypothetical protein